MLSHHGLRYLEESELGLDGDDADDSGVASSPWEAPGVTETPSFEVEQGSGFYLLCMSSEVETYWATNAVAIEKEVIFMTNGSIIKLGIYFLYYNYETWNIFFIL